MMVRVMRRILLVFFSVLLFVSAVFACGFQSSRVSLHQFYRAQGWQLPAIVAAEVSPSANTALPGLVAREIRLDAPGGLIEFPATDFKLDGQPRQMPYQVMKASLTRWELPGSGRVVAYTYNLAPVDAKKESGKWSVSAIGQCTFQASFIDDRGDGIFRLMVMEPMRADLIPAWAKTPKG